MDTETSETTTILVEKLFVLRNATFLHHAEEAVEILFDLVDQHADDEKFMDLAMSLKTMETVVRAMKRSGPSRHFLHLAGGVFFALVRESADRSVHFVTCGGMDRCLEIMETHESDGFLMKAYLALAAVVMGSLEPGQSLSNTGFILELVVAIMEIHDQDAEIYKFGCHALRSCFFSGESIDAELYDRAVQCVVHGVKQHANDEEAKHLGRNLLVAAVGPQYAREMGGKL